MVVRRLSGGVAPSKTNTGRMRWKSSLRMAPTGEHLQLSTGEGERMQSAAAPADAPEEAQQVGVAQHVAARVAHGLDELEQPDGSICTHTQMDGTSCTSRKGMTLHACEE
jgi:hypothetical protein